MSKENYYNEESSRLLPQEVDLCTPYFNEKGAINFQPPESNPKRYIEALQMMTVFAGLTAKSYIPHFLPEGVIEATLSASLTFPIFIIILMTGWVASYYTQKKIDDDRKNILQELREQEKKINNLKRQNHIIEYTNNEDETLQLELKNYSLKGAQIAAIFFSVFVGMGTTTAWSLLIVTAIGILASTSIPFFWPAFALGAVIGIIFGIIRYNACKTEDKINAIKNYLNEEENTWQKAYEESLEKNLTILPKIENNLNQPAELSAPPSATKCKRYIDALQMMTVFGGLSAGAYIPHILPVALIGVTASATFTFPVLAMIIIAGGLAAHYTRKKTEAELKLISTELHEINQKCTVYENKIESIGEVKPDKAEDPATCNLSLAQKGTIFFSSFVGMGTTTGWSLLIVTTMGTLVGTSIPFFWPAFALGLVVGIAFGIARYNACKTDNKITSKKQVAQGRLKTLQENYIGWLYLSRMNFRL
jgi:uncharacterized membrane-anchored protein YhcB (DUF1043 family)